MMRGPEAGRAGEAAEPGDGGSQAPAPTRELHVEYDDAPPPEAAPPRRVGSVPRWRNTFQAPEPPREEDVALRRTENAVRVEPPQAPEPTEAKADLARAPNPLLLVSRMARGREGGEDVPSRDVSAPEDVSPAEREAMRAAVATGKRRELWAPPAYLPEDLREALLSERSQYRAQLLQDVREVSLQGPGVLSLIPRPAADPDWSGGSVLGFLGEECVFGGDVVHLDFESGRVFAAPSHGDDVDRRALSADRWCYRPYDFAEALCAAASAYEERQDALSESLSRACGEAPPVTLTPQDEALIPADRLWRQPWGCIWGPPGTGKTTAVADLIARALRAFPGERILAVAPTNRAADELVLRVSALLEREPIPLRPLARSIFRGGTGASEALVKLPTVMLEDTKGGKLRASIEERERELILQRVRGGPAHELAKLQAELRGLRGKVKDPTLKEVEKGDCPLVVVTVHRALRLVSELEGKRHFARLVVDEAGMVTRAATALLGPLAERVTLAGDPKQIGPVSRAAEGAGKGTQKWLRGSGLSHLEDAVKDAARADVLLLRTQHRMHPDIAKVVSHFCYGGALEDGDVVKQRAERPAPVAAFPSVRAGWVVLDGLTRDSKRLTHGRGETGSGYQRELSANLAVSLAREAVRSGLSVLCVTPYRAQAALLRRLGNAAGLRGDVFSASTIHRQQGTQYDVVLVDTVAGGRPFPPHTLVPMLNVAASRAKDYLLVLASRDEARAATIPQRFLSLLPRLRVHPGEPLRLEPLPMPQRAPPPPPPVPVDLGAEISGARPGKPLFTHEQVSLFERRFDDGHHLVRGVAGSGKTYVLAHWVARYLLEHSEAQVLVSFFNRALAPLVDKLLVEALAQRAGRLRVRELRARVTVRHVGALRRHAPASFDGVFVDEAQDMDAKALAMLHTLVRPDTLPDGREVRCFQLFMDDSQNVYGQVPIDALKEQLPEGLSFRGRTRVLKETFRATRDILDVAFNVVLDPLRQHAAAEPGMREYMKVGELAREGLVWLPEETLEGLFRVQSTERGGVLPQVRGFASSASEARQVAREVARLIREEGVHPSDILVVAPVMPSQYTEALKRAGVPAEAYGGKGGRNVTDFRVSGVDHVRATTVFSCKGHECPIVFFAGLDALDTAEQWMAGARERSARENERIRRAMFYVGATRAMKRQYLTGVKGARFLRVAATYVETLSGLVPAAPSPEGASGADAR